MLNPFEIIDSRLKEIETMLQTLSGMLADQHRPKRAVTSHTLSVKDAANLLKVSKSTIYSFVSKQVIPVSKRGKYLYFSEEELLAWVKAGRKQTIEEIEKEALQGVAKQYRKRNSTAA